MYYSFKLHLLQWLILNFKWWKHVYIHIIANKIAEIRYEKCYAIYGPWFHIEVRDCSENITGGGESNVFWTVPYTCTYLTCTPSLKPICLQTVFASGLDQRWSHIVTLMPSTVISTLPSFLFGPPTKWYFIATTKICRIC